MNAHYLTLAFLAYLGATGALALASILWDWWRARRQVIGTRVRAPEWRARRLTNGQWIVERTKK